MLSVGCLLSSHISKNDKSRVRSSPLDAKETLRLDKLRSMKVEERIRALALIESATLLGILSTLLTWFVSRVEPFPCILLYMDRCPVALVHRGLPLAWMTQVDWPKICPQDWVFFCPQIIILMVDWFGLAVDLLFWTLLFVLLLGLLGLWWRWHVRRRLTGR